MRELHQAAGHAVDPGVRIHDEHHRLGSWKTRNRLSDEIRRTRKVENVDALPLMRSVQEGRVHGVMVRLLFLLEVAHRSAGIDRTLAADFTGVKQKGFGKSGFPARARASEQNVVNVGGTKVGHGRI